MTDKELNEMINWCRNKLANEKNNPFGLSGKRLEGYEQAIKSVMSYLHSKKGNAECSSPKNSLEEQTAKAMFADYAPSKDCYNNDSYGTICVKCEKCGRKFIDGIKKGNS